MKKSSMDKKAPFNSSKKFEYSITYSAWDEESLEMGETDDKGYEVEPEVENISEILYKSFDKYGIYYPVSIGTWESTEPKEDTDFYEKDIRKYYVLHLRNEDGTEISEEDNDFITHLLSNGQYNREYFEEYAFGGLLGDKRWNRSWHFDHDRYNKSESYEIPMSKRKKAMGGDVQAERDWLDNRISNLKNLLSVINDEDAPELQSQISRLEKERDALGSYADGGGVEWNYWKIEKNDETIYERTNVASPNIPNAKRISKEEYDANVNKEFADGGEILKKTIVYDNNGDTFDRYTVFTPDGSVYGMSDNPTSPQGFNQYLGDDTEVEKGEHLGRKLKSVPKSIEKAILDRMEDDYKLGGGIYSSDELYILKVYDLDGKLLDDSKRVWGRNISKAKEEAIDMYEYPMQQKYGTDLRFTVELAPQMMKHGGGLMEKDDNYRYIVSMIENNEKSLEKNMSTDKAEETQREIQRLKDKLKHEYGQTYAKGGGVQDNYAGKKDEIIAKLKSIKGGLDNKAPKVFVKDNLIYVSAENGDNYADYYASMYIDEKLEAVADEYDTYWDWEDAGSIVLTPIDEYAKGGEIDSLKKELKKLENIDSKEAYEKSNEIRQRIAYLQAKKLHQKDNLREEGGEAGEMEDWMNDAIKDLRSYTDNNDLKIENINDDDYFLASDGSHEYLVFEDFDEAHEYAVDDVKNNLEENPEYFQRDWLMAHLEAGNFFRNVYDEWNMGYATDIMTEDDDKYPNRLIAEMVQWGIMDSDEANGRDAEEIANDRMSDFVNALTDDQINQGNDGFDYYIDNFGEEEAFNMAVKNNLIDIESASEDAVNVDGVAHFISSYDGEEIALNNGSYAYRIN